METPEHLENEVYAAALSDHELGTHKRRVHTCFMSFGVHLIDPKKKNKISAEQQLSDNVVTSWCSLFRILCGSRDQWLAANAPCKTS